MPVYGHDLDSSALAHNSSFFPPFFNVDSKNSGIGAQNSSDCFHEHPDDATLGALATSLLIGYLINWGLLGLLTSQVYTYYMGFPNDHKGIKFLVYALFLVELAQTIMATRDAIVVYSQGLMNSKQMMNQVMHMVHNGSFPGFNTTSNGLASKSKNVQHAPPGFKIAFNCHQNGSSIPDPFINSHPTINKVHLLWLTVPVIAGIVGFVGQLFFAYRLYILSKSRVLSALIISLGLIATAAALLCGGRMLFLQQLMTGLHDPLFLVTCGLWNGFAALSDVIIAACMTYYLSKRDTVFSETQILLNKLKRLTIETGTLTATAAILNVVLYVGFRSRPRISAFFTIPAAAIAKLYSISILSSMNSRLLFSGGRYSMKTEISSADSAVPYDKTDRLLVFQKQLKLQPQSPAEVRIEQHTITWREDDVSFGSIISEKRRASHSLSTKGRQGRQIDSNETV